jgi:hypothetical protein
MQSAYCKGQNCVMFVIKLLYKLSHDKTSLATGFINYVMESVLSKPASVTN